MARKTAAERREEEYRIEQRFRNLIANVNTWEEARLILQEQPPSGYPGAAMIGEFGYYFGHLQRAVEGLPPYNEKEPEYDKCIPAGASPEELKVFQTIVPRLVLDKDKSKLAVEALQRAINKHLQS